MTAAMWDDSHDADWDAYARQVAAQAVTNATILRNLNRQEDDQ